MKVISDNKFTSYYTDEKDNMNDIKGFTVEKFVGDEFWGIRAMFSDSVFFKLRGDPVFNTRDEAEEEAQRLYAMFCGSITASKDKEESNV